MNVTTSYIFHILKIIYKSYLMYKLAWLGLGLGLVDAILS
jgi:hypothetical protein